jgi:SAM-dependent methyltransferase
MVASAKVKFAQQIVFDRHGQTAVPGDWDPRLLAKLFRDSDLAGKRVLDMGANTGGLSLELSRRGAYVHAAEPWKPNDAAQELARKEGLDLEWSKAGLFDSHKLGCFDTIVCFGLIYHFRNPQYVLDYLSSLGATTLYLSCQTIPGDELVMRNRNDNNEKHRVHDGVRGYEPTHRLLRLMMSAAGFGSIELLTDREYVRPEKPRGLTNTAYYRATLIRSVDPHLLNLLFEARDAPRRGEVTTRYEPLKL